jgi:dolichyl-phosphate-mannose--protein O-mannosyl transferase
LASLFRLINLGYPKSLVFDETYYVKDAYTLWKAGHELQWTKDVNKQFIAGDFSGVTDAPEFVVHSPLGKWLIGLGMQVFGPANPFGWRIVPALAGIASVWLLYLIALKLFGSKRWALLPAFLLAIDGQAIVISRTAILDGLVSFFILLGFWVFLKTLDQEKPWRLFLLLGVVFGAGAGVKWTALAFFAVFLGYYLLHVGFKKVWVALLALPTLAVTYLAAWTGWFVTRGWGYREDDVIGSFIDYHRQIWQFHSNLASPHPYKSPAITWLADLRPTSFFWEAQDDFATAINPIGNPVLWWGGIVALGFLVSWFFRNRDKLGVLVLTGYIAGWVPWLIYSERTAFQFYSVSFEPWIALAITLMAIRYRTQKAVVYAGIFALAFTLFFLPLYLAISAPLWVWQIHMWLPSWI